MEKAYLELKTYFEETIQEKNALLVNDLKKLFSKEFLSILHSECLLEDLDFIDNLKEQDAEERYINLVIRNMCEQIIEYKYLIANPYKIENYFGINAYPDEVEIIENIENISMRDFVNSFKRCSGKDRFADEVRENVANMSKKVNEYESTDEKISLYDIYQITSELMHNSYYHVGLELVGKLEDEKNESAEMQEIFLIFLISSFLDTYENV